jgi:hypothetical protein
MDSLATIQQMSAKAARKAKASGKKPALFQKGMDALQFCRSIPNLGGYTPKGYMLFTTYMVDSSGMGSSDEPALTISQFCDSLKDDVYYGIIETGQFQIVMGEFSLDV